MKESEYIRAGNCTRLRSCKMILSDCLPGTEYGIDPADWTDAHRLLDQMIARATKSLGTLKEG